MPYFMRKERDKYCVFKGTSNDPGDLVKCHDSQDGASAHLRALLANVSDAKGVDIPVDKGLPAQTTSGPADWESMSAEDIMKAVGKGDEIVTEPITDGEQDKNTDPAPATDEPASKDKFIVYKSGDAYRWLAISNVAIQDKEFETLTDKSYDDAIAMGKSLGYGELDLVHVPGTDVGDCDLMLRLGAGDEAKLVEGGPWHNTPRATKARQVVQEDPAHWGVSIKFVYDPAQFVDGVYHGGIRIKKRTILPRHMAASYGTAIAVLGGEQKMKELDQETRDALSKLGIEEKEIELLAEQSKSLPDEPNTRTKENESVLDTIKTLIAKALGANQQTQEPQAPEQETAKPDVAEQSKTTETEVSPAESPQEPTETTKETDVGNTPVEEPTVASEEVVKVIAETVAQSLAPSIQQAVQPLADTLASIRTWQDAIEKRVAETEKDIETKVTEKLEAQPPVVKVRTSELKQAETDEPSTTILDSPAENYRKELMESVRGIVTSALKGKLDMPEIKLSE